ncbi:MAG: SRPBCC family protein [Micrococcaceae bacterium]
MTTNQTAHGDTKITVTRTIDAPAKDVFEVLTLPDNHAKIDGSGTVVSEDHTDRIQQVGDVFRMNMNGDHMGGDYQTDNHVVAYDENKLVGWKTAPAGTQPPGWQWVYTLEPVEQDSTRVSLTYDWSDVTDPDLLAKNLFPLFDEEQLEGSLARLAALLH